MLKKHMKRRRKNKEENERDKITRALVVTGDAISGAALKNIMGSNGYELTTVTTGAEALALVEETFYHFAVLDHHLSDMRGLELLEKIRKINGKINCIMMTDNSQDDPESSFMLGAKAQLLKPLGLEELKGIFGDGKD